MLGTCLISLLTLDSGFQRKLKKFVPKKKKKKEKRKTPKQRTFSPQLLKAFQRPNDFHEKTVKEPPIFLEGYLIEF